MHYDTPTVSEICIYCQTPLARVGKDVIVCPNPECPGHRK
jgi:hypothetical protein